MALIGKFAKDKNQANFIGAALIAAGANRQGVIDAIKVSY